MDEKVMASPESCKPNSAFRRAWNRIKRFIYGIFHHEKSESDSWMENEIKIACGLERGASGVKDGDWDYGCACYQSAARVYKSLLKDGHSGFSIGLTQNILNRLIDHKPLTPIEDTPDVWNDISDMSGLHGEEVNYQCKRMSALFKYVYADGTIKYKDIDAAYCIDVDSHSTYHSGLVQKIIDEMFPVTMPYYPPTHPMKVYCSDLLTDRKNGDFDTVAIFYVVKPSGERIEINRFFKEADNESGWDEITAEEYDARKVLHEQRAKAQAEEYEAKIKAKKDAGCECAGCTCKPAPADSEAQRPSEAVSDDE